MSTKDYLLSAAAVMDALDPELSGAVLDRMERGEIDAAEVFRIAVEYCRIEGFDVSLPAD